MSDRSGVKIQATLPMQVVTVIDSIAEVSSVYGSTRSEVIADILKTWVKEQLEKRSIDPFSDLDLLTTKQDKTEGER